MPVHNREKETLGINDFQGFFANMKFGKKYRFVQELAWIEIGGVNGTIWICTGQYKRTK